MTIYSVTYCYSIEISPRQTALGASPDEKCGLGSGCGGIHPSPLHTAHFPGPESSDLAHRLDDLHLLPGRVHYLM